MKKVTILLIPIFLTVLNGFSQSEGEMTNTSQETVFLQSFTNLVYSDIKSWKVWENSDTSGLVFDEHYLISDSSAIESTLIAMSDNQIIPGEISYTFKTYQYENGVDVLKIEADILLKEEKIAKRVFVQKSISGIYESIDKKYFLNDQKSEYPILNDCGAKISIHKTTMIIPAEPNREVIIASATGQQIFRKKIQEDLEYDITNMKGLGVYIVIINDNKAWCSSKFLQR